jgi:2',3'-cyclic-nucleotide 2'-phosphodiesterase
MRIMLIGDVIGRPGRHAVSCILPDLRREEQIDIVVANGENSAGGRGLTPETADELLGSGVDVLTSGNHVFRQREILQYLEMDVPVLRPLNYPAGVPGRGHTIVRAANGTQVLVINLCGRVNLMDLDSPFQRVDRLLRDFVTVPPIAVVDFHAETTSEKEAMGWFLDGRVSAVVGTHTHVPTADARLLRHGTAYVSDLGMVGPYNSILGDKIEPILGHFLTQMPARFEVADGGPIVFNSVVVDIDSTGRARSIRRIDRFLED